MTFNALLVVWMSANKVYAVSIDCPNVIEFARGLGMQTAQPAIWTALQIDCCTANGVTCAGQRVTGMGWYQMGLNGAINGAALPGSLNHLTLARNQLTGSIPNALPSGLTILHLDGNQMSGNLPSLPSTIRELVLGWPGVLGNRFTGTLRLNRPTYLWIIYNLITDVVIQDISGLVTCELSENPLLGNPNIAGLTMCTKNGLYSAALPVTTTVVKTTKTTATVVKMTSKVATIETKVVTTSLARMVKTTMESTDCAEIRIMGLETTIGLTKDAGTQGFTTIIGMISNKTITPILGTVQFTMLMSDLDVNLKMMIRLLISWMLVTLAISKTPFTRKLRSMTMNKSGNRKETRSLGF